MIHIRNPLISRVLDIPIAVTTTTTLKSSHLLVQHHNGPIQIQSRCLSTTSCLGRGGTGYLKSHACKTFSENRMAKNINKLMSGKRNPNSATHYRTNPSQNLQDFAGLTKGASGGNTSHLSPKVLRRVSVLNTIFIEHITGLLATGEVSPEFLGLSVQIAKVKIKTDFSGVNVYWYATGSVEKDEKIEKLLKDTSGHLRSVLCSLRVIGIVPPIHFFKDTSMVKFQEVQSLLEKCDMGRDEFTLQEGEEEESSSPPEEENVMRQDMLGIRYDYFMAEIMKSMKSQRERKAMKEQRLGSAPMGGIPIKEDDPSSPSNLSEAMETYEVQKQRQKDFLNYLNRRQAEKARLVKSLSVEAKEREFLREQAEERIESQRQSRLDALDPYKDLDEEDDNVNAEEYYRQEEEYYNNFREDFK